jgi:hypothetical protein
VGGSIVLTIMRVVRRRCLLVLISAMLLTALAAAQNPEQRTAHYLESIRKQPQLLLAFVRDLPKGGDLHNHLGAHSMPKI